MAKIHKTMSFQGEIVKSSLRSVFRIHLLKLQQSFMRF